MFVNGGHVVLDPADLEAFVADARRIVMPTARSLPGCLFFSIAVDDRDAGRALVFEHWRDQAELDELLARPEVKAHFAKWTPRMTLEVRKFDAFNERGAME